MLQRSGGRQLERDCTGQYILIDGRRYFILGVVETRSESSMFRDGVSDSEVFVPFNTADNWLHFVLGAAMIVSGFATTREQHAVPAT